MNGLKDIQRENLKVKLKLRRKIDIAYVMIMDTTSIINIDIEELF